MSEAKHPSLTVGQDDAAPERDGVKALKTWATPKVITSQLSEDTASGNSHGSDGHGSSHNS